MRPVSLLVAILVGCSGAVTPSAPPTVTIAAPQPAPEPEATEPPPAPVVNVPKRPNPTVAAGDVIGVPECDAYLARFAICLSKMPPPTHEAVKEALARTRQAWAQAAATPVNRAGLATGCRAALDALAQNPLCR